MMVVHLAARPRDKHITPKTELYIFSRRKVPRKISLESDIALTTGQFVAAKSKTVCSYRVSTKCIAFWDLW